MASSKASMHGQSFVAALVFVLSFQSLLFINTHAMQHAVATSLSDIFTKDLTNHVIASFTPPDDTVRMALASSKQDYQQVFAPILHNLKMEFLNDKINATCPPPPG